MAMRVLLLLFIIFTIGYTADLSFYGYYETQGIDTIYKVQRNLGNFGLQNSQVDISHKVTYLDITEKSTIIGTPYSVISDIYLDTFSIEGTFDLPDGAVLLGSTIEKDGQIFKSHLELDTLAIDSTIDTVKTEIIGTDIFRIRKKSKTQYTLEIRDLGLSEEITIAIRYLLPNSGNGHSQFTVPVVFKPRYGNTPNKVSTNLTPSTEEGFRLITNTGKLTIKQNTSLILEFQDKLRIEPFSDIQSSSIIHTTQVTSDEWSGYYLQLNTNIPDSVLGSLSKKMEVVFLWRWNNPSSFTEFHSYYGNRLTGHGWNAVNQAKQLNNTITKLTNTTHKAALIHSIDNEDRTDFPMATTNSLELLNIQQHLSQYSEQHILEKYYKEDNNDADWIPDEVTEEKPKNSIQEFKDAITASVAMYTDVDGVLRHLVIVSAGPIKNVPNSIEKSWIDQMLLGVTTDVSQAKWRGASFDLLVQDPSLQKLSKQDGYFFPEHKPDNVTLQIGNANKAYTFFLSTSKANTFSLKAKSAYTWLPTLSWTGYNKNGDLLGTVISTPTPIARLEDTALVKLWAGDENRLSEESSKQMGKKYGIVSYDNSLVVYDNDTSSVDETIDFLTKEHQIVPDAILKSTKNSSTFSVHLQHKKLHLSIPNQFSAEKIQLYSLSGQLLAEVDISDIYSDELILNLQHLNLGSGIFILHVIGEKKTITSRLVIK